MPQNDQTVPASQVRAFLFLLKDPVSLLNTLTCLTVYFSIASYYLHTKYYEACRDKTCATLNSCQPSQAELPLFVDNLHVTRKLLIYLEGLFLFREIYKKARAWFLIRRMPSPREADQIRAANSVNWGFLLPLAINAFFFNSMAFELLNDASLIKPCDFILQTTALFMGMSFFNAIPVVFMEYCSHQFFNTRSLENAAASTHQPTFPSSP